MLDLKEGLHVSPKPFRIFYVQAMKTAVGFEVTDKRVHLGVGEGLQIPCILHVSGEAKFVSKLKDISSQLM